MRTVRSSSHVYPSMQWGMHWKGVSAGGRVSTQGGVCLAGVCRGAVSAEEGVSQHAVGQTTPPPLKRMTNMCKNITLPQLCCGR